MKKFTKIMALALVFAMCLTCLSACGKAESESVAESQPADVSESVGTDTLEEEKEDAESADTPAWDDFFFLLDGTKVSIGDTPEYMAGVEWTDLDGNIGENMLPATAMMDFQLQNDTYKESTGAHSPYAQLTMSVSNVEDEDMAAGKCPAWKLWYTEPNPEWTTAPRPDFEAFGLKIGANRKEIIKTLGEPAEESPVSPGTTHMEFESEDPFTKKSISIEYSEEYGMRNIAIADASWMFN